MHPLKALAWPRQKVAIAQTDYVDRDIVAVRFTDKGSIIQRVADEVLAQDASMLIKGRWKPLEREWESATTWMVRDGWFQRPVMLLWRLSLASWYIALGFNYAFMVLRKGERYR